ncbi:MAG: glycine cleavage system H protein [Pseudomonadota bacterium]
MEIQGYNLPDDLYYDQDHYWSKLEGGVLVMGMDDFAQKLAGELVFVQLPFEGKKVQGGKKFAKVESGKWVGKILAPVDGEIVAVNSDLETKPSLINQDCYGAGWMYKIKPDDPAQMEKLIHGPENIRKYLLADIEKFKKD